MAAEPNILAAAKFAAKAIVGSVFNTAEWGGTYDPVKGWTGGFPLALRDSAFFSAEVENLRLLQRMQTMIQNGLDKLRGPARADGSAGIYQSRENFVADAREFAQREGLDPRGLGMSERSGTVRDITSVARMRLIYDQQTAHAQEFARWKAGQDQGVLDATPAQELVRVEIRKVPRTNWPERWDEAGGLFFDGRMIALKSDPVWAKLSRFGTPWPPFDFGSGMGVRNVRRAEAEQLGLIQPGEVAKPSEGDFRASLQKSVADLSPEYRRQLQNTFGDQIEITGDTVKWREAE